MGHSSRPTEQLKPMQPRREATEGRVTTDRRAATDRAKTRWDRAAAAYDWTMPLFERLLLDDGRSWLTSRARGDVLEIGIGTGRNLSLYPPEVRLTGVDLSRRMLARARRRAIRLGRPVDLRLGDAERLDFPAGSFDTVVFSLALCSIPDDRQAIREARRVLRPGGRLLALEHVRSGHRAVRIGQRVIDLVSARLLGDHQLREPLEHLLAEGFEVEELERTKLGIIERIRAVKPHGRTEHE